MVDLLSGIEGIRGCLDLFGRLSLNLVPQYGGRLLHEVVAKPNTEGFLSQTSAALGYHSDGHDYHVPPKYIALYCESAAESDCETFFSEFKPALSLLAPGIALRIASETFQFHSGAALYWKTPHAGVLAPIYNEQTGVVRYSYEYLKPFSSAEELLNELEPAFAAAQTTVRLKRGDLLLLNNWEYVHGRHANSNPGRKLLRFWLA